MSRMPLIMIAGMLGAAFALSPAAAAPNDPFGKANCREARLDQVVEGTTVSSSPVIICKRTERPRSMVMRTQHAPVVVTSSPAPQPRPVERVAFGPTVPPGVECARLDCPTFVLSGVGF
jgi:hypothetical protein